MPILGLRKREHSLLEEVVMMEILVALATGLTLVIVWLACALIVLGIGAAFLHLFAALQGIFRWGTK